MSSEFTISQGAGQKLEFAFQRNGVGSDVLEWLSAGGNLHQIGLLVRGEAKLVINTKVAPTPEPKVEADSIIRVDRSTRLYPDWVKEVVNPELESVGSAEYDISAVEQWFHDGQKDGKLVKGTKIWADLNKSEILKDHLSLQDLEGIQKKSTDFFRKHFKGKTVFGWKSVMRDRNGDLYVPCLYESDDGVVLCWCWTGDDLYGDCPALRFVSGSQD